MSGTTTKEEELTSDERATLARNIQYVDGLVARAKGGDESVIPELRKVMRQVPSLYEGLSRIADCAIYAWSTAIGGKDLLHRECVIREFWNYAAVIVGPKPTTLEKSLAQRVSLCRMQTLHAEAALGQMGNDAFTKRGETLEKRIASCQKRFSRAHKDLTMYQKQTGNLPCPVPEQADGLDPAQHYAQQLKEQQEAQQKQASQPRSPDGQRAADPAAVPAAKQVDPVHREPASAATDPPTEVPLIPRVAGTNRVVTSRSMLDDSGVPDSHVSGVVNSSADKDRQEWHLGVPKGSRKAGLERREKNCGESVQAVATVNGERAS